MTFSPSIMEVSGTLFAACHNAVDSYFCWGLWERGRWQAFVGICCCIATCQRHCWRVFHTHKCESFWRPLSSPSAPIFWLFCQIFLCTLAGRSYFSQTVLLCFIDLTHHLEFRSKLSGKLQWIPNNSGLNISYGSNGPSGLWAFTSNNVEFKSLFTLKTNLSDTSMDLQISVTGRGTWRNTGTCWHLSSVMVMAASEGDCPHSVLVAVTTTSSGRDSVPPVISCSPTGGRRQSTAWSCRAPSCHLSGRDAESKAQQLAGRLPFTRVQSSPAGTVICVFLWSV